MNRSGFDGRNRNPSEQTDNQSGAQGGEPSGTSQSQGTMSVINSDSPKLAIPTLGGRDSLTFVRSAVAPLPMEGPPVSGRGGNLPSSSRHVIPQGLARERWNLNAAGLPSSVIHTIQSARASFIRTLYGNKWRVFEEWFERRVVIPFQCSVKDILCFLQDLSDKGKAFSTIKVYLAANSACHIGFGEKSCLSRWFHYGIYPSS